MKRISRAKLNRLVDLTFSILKNDKDTRFIYPDDQIRWRIFTVFEQVLDLDAQIDREVRQKLKKAHRNVPEGSSEWYVLYRKYYSEALEGLGRFRR